MTLEMIIFIVLVFTTFFNNGVQAYIHFEAYPLLAFVGKSEFSAYIKEYEGRLTLPLLVPYALTVLSNLVLLFVRSDKISLVWVIVALLLNLSVATVTMLVATPVYNRIKQSGQATPPDLGQLMRINLLRLALSTLSSAVICYLLYSLLVV